MAQPKADCWPKRVASPNMHPLLCSLAPKNKLWFLGLGYIWGKHSSPHETAYMLKNGKHTHTKLFHRLFLTKSWANAIEAFHRAFGGRMFRHEQQGNGGNAACPTFSEHNLGLRPLPTTFQLNKNKHQFKDKMPQGFEQECTNGALKYTNGNLLYHKEKNKMKDCKNTSGEYVSFTSRI